MWTSASVNSSHEPFDFAVPRGGLTMLLGRNGAGKTTCLRTIMGLWKASAGRMAGTPGAVFWNL